MELSIDPETAERIVRMPGYNLGDLLGRAGTFRSRHRVSAHSTAG
jgi:hypothetical protein